MRFSKPLEASGAYVASATALVLIAQQVAGKATRDALFLSSFDVSTLPIVMAVAAVLTLGVVLGLSGVISSRSPANLTPLLFGASAAMFFVEWALHGESPAVVAVAVYLHTALLSPVMLTTFWSFVNERFDPHTAKRAFSRITGGGTLGGVVGGLAAWRASMLVDLPTMLLLLGVLNASGIALSIFVRVRKAPLIPVGGVSESEANARAAPPLSAIGELLKAPYLRNLALLVAVSSAISSLLDYVFSAQATLAFGSGTPLLAFFSLFWLVVSVVSFVLQVSVGRLALEKLGVAVNIAFLPGIILMGSTFGLAVPGLLSGALLRGGEAVQRNTLFRAAYELLYSPLAEARRRATKALIDVGFDRVGTVLGSGVALVILRLVPHPAQAVMLGAVVVLAFATLPLVRRLHFGYIASLQRSLREQTAKVDAPAREDTGEIRNREKIVQQVEAMQPGGLAALIDVAEGGAPQAAKLGPATQALDHPRATESAVLDLLSGDDARIRRGLSEVTGPGPALSCAVLLLGHAELHTKVQPALRRVAPLVTGQLIDALIDPTMDYLVRRRIPSVLADCNSQRAADGLALGLLDERFEVRYQCGRALLQIVDAKPSVVIARDPIIEAVQRELEENSDVLESGASEELDEAPTADVVSPLMGTLVRDRVHRSLEHVFALLSLHLEREPLRMAFQALFDDDERNRGTALEYLSLMLPSEIREAIWPFLGTAAPLPTARAAQEVLTDLEQAAAARRTGGQGEANPHG